MKRTDPRQIGDIINEALHDAGLSSTFDEQKALNLWPEIVGQGINRYTSRRWVDRGTLHVCLTSASMKQELSFHRGALVDRINDAVGRRVISEIQIH